MTSTISTPPANPAAPPARLADTMYHDLLSPAEVSDVRSRVRTVAHEFISPLAQRISHGDERIDGFPRDAFDALAVNGVFRIPFPGDVGGDDLRHPATATATAVEELAYHSNSVAAIFDVHCILAGNAVNQGTDEQRQRWLAPVVKGDIVGSFATSEPAASSDLSPSAVSTVAERRADGWILNGRKRWITNSAVAAFVVVLARTGDRLSTFIVPTDTPGVRIGVPDRKLGNNGQITADVILDDVELGAATLLGEEGGGLKVALQTLTYGRIGIAAAGVGMAQAAFDHTAAHLKSRHAFGEPLAAKQHWQFLMADRATEIAIARDLYLKAALRLDSGTAFPEPEAAMAKLRGTEISVQMARDAIQAFGGFGFTRELGDDDSSSPVEAIYRDAKIGEIYEGANEIQRWVLARQIFGRDITG
ncbi:MULTISPECIES: acyl-CoA dehydrogenase family protein [unclassified Gordonia (in: high G+C Gram-positive bacteria)]|uniref:acyl-CoA dehydrogenase family protein n=1 Tax=unclassified Gordonia (in: high G+C Gram-positive bacteria) TaxID=2657482 RepID=UPI001F0D427E|nr:acyl-CoA dehydrogenase family protein [Gordonia sp. ABSL49_1]MCH5643249.1 acyl-CoA dehydrogenase family protein [Gordonia sp. ABSL49_1]